MEKLSAVRRPLRLALEGPCLAGKTTLGRALVAELVGIRSSYVSDYSDFVGGGRYLPPAVPASVTQEAEALEKFLKIEQERTCHVGGMDENLTIIDRSAHTLIAHCWGIERMTSLCCAELASEMLMNSSIPLWPDVILYLDISVEVAATRNSYGKFPDGSVFIDAAYNNGFKQYFEEACRVTGLVIINASMSQRNVTDAALGKVRSIIEKQ